MVGLPLHWLETNDPTRWLSISHKLLLTYGHREAQLRDELEEHWGEMDFALSADQMKHWFIILIETTLNIGISSQKPVDSKESKHSGRLSKFFSPHWIAGVVSQA